MAAAISQLFFTKDYKGHTIFHHLAIFVWISLLFVLCKTLGFVLLTFFLFYKDTMMIIEDRFINILYCMPYFNIILVILL